MNAQAAYGILAHGLIFGAFVALLPLGELRARAALAEVRRTTGSQFCPRCVTALLGLVARGALDELGLPRRALVRSVPAAAGG